MRARLAVLAVVAASLSTGAVTPARADGAVAPAEMRLANGLTVIVVEDHSLPVVSLRLVYRLGDAPSPQGLHLVAPRLMLDATRHVQHGQYDSFLEVAGGRDSTWSVTLDETLFSVTVPSHQVDLPLWLWSDQMAFLAPRLDPPMMARAAALAVQDRRMRIDDAPCGIAEQEMRRALYAPSHPYRVAPRGVPDDVDKTDLETMRRFLAAAYEPTNAALIVVGDIGAADAREHAQKWFGDIPSGPRAATPVDESLPADETRVVARARVDAPRIRVAWRIPAGNDVPSHWKALRQLLGGSETALLRWKLREHEHLATSVDVTYERRAHGSVFSVDAVLLPGHEPDEALAAIDAFFKDLVAHAPAAWNVRWARMEAARELALGSETTSQRASRLEHEWVVSGRAGDSEGTAFDDATIIELVGLALRPERRAVFECLPDPAAPIAGVVVSRTTPRPATP